MRSLLLIFTTLLALLIVCGIYLWLQAGVVRQEQHVKAPPVPGRLLPDGGDNVIGRGEGAWVIDDSGRAKLRFRAAEYAPQRDQTMTVERPEVEIRFDGGQMVRIQGAAGTVDIPEGPRGGRNPLAVTAPQTPHRGRMQQVRISLFDHAGSPAPQYIIELDNAAFDNETFQIYTVAHRDEDGTWIEADQVPVRVRGADYDFDGRGMILRWNERDGILQYLEITHGERLIIKNASPRFGRSMADAGTPPPVRMMLASADSAAAAEAIPAPAAEQRSPVYRAVFHDSVLVRRDEQDMAEADLLEVDFLMSSAGDGGAEQDAPAPQPADEAHGRLPADGRPGTARTPGAAELPGSAEPVDAESPTIIYWTGRLTVQPLKDEQSPPLPRGEAVVRLIGSPLVLRQEQSEIRAASLRYRSADASVVVEASPQFPLTMTDAGGATVTSESMHWSTQDGIAVLHGQSRARWPVAAEAGQEPQVLAAEWTRTCTLYFADGPQQRMVIDRADLEGAVEVDHPQIRLRSDRLELGFDSAPRGDSPASDGAGGNLRRLLASGNVAAELADADGKAQHITSDQLELETGVTPGGRIYPQTLRADGGVDAHDDTQRLRAGHLTVVLIPADEGDASSSASAPAVDLQSLLAEDDVIITTADGASADADRFTVTLRDGRPLITLSGEPYARIADGDNVLTGERMEIDPDEQRAAISGPGSLHIVQQESAEAPARPVEVTWTRSASIDALGNRIDAAGEVMVTSTDAGGAVNTARGRRLTLTLAGGDLPDGAAKPQVDAADAAAAPRMQFLQNKLVQSAQFDEDVEVASILSGEAGELLRRLNLLAETVVYDVPGQRLVVPLPGRLLFEDRRPRTSAADEAEPARISDSRGATAVQWNDRLTYDQSAGRITLTGGVDIVHHPQASDAAPFRIEAGQVHIDLANGADAAGVPDADDRLALVGLQAQDQVRFTSGELHFEAAAVEYNPATGLLTARGTERRPAQLFDGGGLSRGSFQELRYNVQSGQIESIQEFRAQVRPTER